MCIRDRYDKVLKLLDEFISNSKYLKYNYLGLINSLFNRESICEDRFLCSEFVYYILNKAGIAELNKPRNLVRPQDLLNLKSRVIFKGNLKNKKFIKKYENNFIEKYSAVGTLS